MNMYRMEEKPDPPLQADAFRGLAPVGLRTGVRVDFGTSSLRCPAGKSVAPVSASLR